MKVRERLMRKVMAVVIAAATIFFDKRRDEGCAGQGCGRSGRGIG